MQTIRRLSLLTFCLAAAFVIRAQVITSQLTGRVTDATGALVPGAQVEIMNRDTGLDRTAQTNDDGYYTVPLLPPGQYQVSVKKEGFRPVTRTGISLRVDVPARLDFSIEVGSLS